MSPARPVKIFMLCELAWATPETLTSIARWQACWGYTGVLCDLTHTSGGACRERRRRDGCSAREQPVVQPGVAGADGDEALSDCAAARQRCRVAGHREEPVRSWGPSPVHCRVQVAVVDQRPAVRRDWRGLGGSPRNRAVHRAAVAQQCTGSESPAHGAFALVRDRRHRLSARACRGHAARNLIELCRFSDAKACRELLRYDSTVRPRGRDVATGSSIQGLIEVPPARQVGVPDIGQLRAGVDGSRRQRRPPAPGG